MLTRAACFAFAHCQQDFMKGGDEGRRRGWDRCWFLHLAFGEVRRIISSSWGGRETYRLLHHLCHERGAMHQLYAIDQRTTRLFSSYTSLSEWCFTRGHKWSKNSGQVLRSDSSRGLSTWSDKELLHKVCLVGCTPFCVDCVQLLLGNIYLSI